MTHDATLYAWVMTLSQTWLVHIFTQEMTHNWDMDAQLRHGWFYTRRMCMGHVMYICMSHVTSSHIYIRHELSLYVSHDSFTDMTYTHFRARHDLFKTETWLILYATYMYGSCHAHRHEPRYFIPHIYRSRHVFSLYVRHHSITDMTHSHILRETRLIHNWGSFYMRHISMVTSFTHAWVTSPDPT